MFLERLEEPKAYRVCHLSQSQRNTIVKKDI